MTIYLYSIITIVIYQNIQTIYKEITYAFVIKEMHILNHVFICDDVFINKIKEVDVTLPVVVICNHRNCNSAI